jgi:peptidoglycan/LPS O-acetylase OafA/YrhL
MEGLGWPAAGAAVLIGAVMALLLAELLWRTVEAPMIAAGKRMSAMSTADLKLSLRRFWLESEGR